MKVVVEVVVVAVVVVAVVVVAVVVVVVVVVVYEWHCEMPESYRAFPLKIQPLVPPWQYHREQ